MRRIWLALAAALLTVAALAAAALAHDARSWRDGLAVGDERFAAAPASARWHAQTWLPGDPAGTALAASGDVALREAVQDFLAALHTGRGFDNGEHRARVRSAAESALARVAAGANPEEASQANDLLGVLQALGSGATAEELALASFQAAVRADPSNTAAKANLELTLRRLQAIRSRRGPGNGSGPRGSGRRGAGSGTPGRGY